MNVFVLTERVDDGDVVGCTKRDNYFAVVICLLRQSMRAKCSSKSSTCAANLGVEIPNQEEANQSFTTETTNDQQHTQWFTRSEDRQK